MGWANATQSLKNVSAREVGHRQMGHLNVKGVMHSKTL